jgi:hypothetical protein
MDILTTVGMTNGKWEMENHPVATAPGSVFEYPKMLELHHDVDWPAASLADGKRGELI